MDYTSFPALHIMTLKKAQTLKTRRPDAQEDCRLVRCASFIPRAFFVFLPTSGVPIEGCGELLLRQKTPLRVLHRRTQAVRERAVYAMRAAVLGSHFLLLDLTTQAGTYVKEFVHGDLGRTLPNVGAILGCDADILQLDVVGLQDPS